MGETVGWTRGVQPTATIQYPTAPLHSVLATTALPPWFQPLPHHLLPAQLLLHHHLLAHLVHLLPPLVHQAAGPTNLLEEAATLLKDSSQPSHTSFSSFSHSSWGQTLLQTLDRYMAIVQM